MSRSFLLTCVAKDLIRRGRDFPAIAMWIGIPLMIGTLLALVSSGNGGVPVAKVLLVDEDESLLSGFLAGAAGQGEAAEFLQVETVDLEEGRARIDAGDASALLILPDGFQDGVLLEEPTTLTLVTNPAQRILPAIVREGLEMVVEATFYLQRLVGEPLREIAEGPPDGATTFDNETVAGFSQAFNSAAQGLDGTLFPPALTVSMVGDEAEAEGDEATGSGDFNIGNILLPGIMFMSVLFIASGMAGDLWDERMAGTLRRFVSTPRSVAVLLAGKIIAAGIVMTGAALVGFIVGIAAFGISPWRAPAAVAWTTFVGMALFALFLFVTTLASTQRTAEMVDTLILFPLFMIGGSMFPFDAMPSWMVAIGRWTPNGAGVIALRQILDGVITPGGLATAIVGIGVPAAIAFALCVRRVSGGFAAAQG